VASIHDIDKFLRILEVYLKKLRSDYHRRQGAEDDSEEKDLAELVRVYTESDSMTRQAMLDGLIHSLPPKINAGEYEKRCLYPNAVDLLQRLAKAA
jgi:hypothetical protein